MDLAVLIRQGKIGYFADRLADVSHGSQRRQTQQNPAKQWHARYPPKEI